MCKREFKPEYCKNFQSSRFFETAAFLILLFNTMFTSY